jgi:hypothetical protein
MSRTFKAAVRGVDVAGGRVHLSFDPTPQWFSLPEPELARHVRWNSTATVRVEEGEIVALQVETSDGPRWVLGGPE